MLQIENSQRFHAAGRAQYSSRQRSVSWKQSWRQTSNLQSTTDFKNGDERAFAFITTSQPDYFCDPNDITSVRWCSYLGYFCTVEGNWDASSFNYVSGGQSLGAQRILGYPCALGFGVEGNRWQPMEAASFGSPEMGHSLRSPRS